MHCPVCNLKFEVDASPAKPFCSKRCQTIDLGRWLDESNSLPHLPDPEEDEKPDDDWTGERSFEAIEPSKDLPK